MSTFKRNGPVYLKTYGKNKRKMEMWLSPDVRKKAFSSTSSSDLSISLMSNSSLLPQRKKKPTRSSRMTRAAKKRALTALKEKDSDEENIYHLNAEPCQNDQKRKGPFTTALPKQTKKKRKKPLVLVISESEDESEENSAETGQKRTCMGKPIKSVRSDNTPLLLADVGRFVTNRRKQHEKQKSTNKRKVQTKENVCIFDSSADSTEDFVRPHVPRQSVAKRKPIHKAELFLEDAGSDIDGTLSNFRRISLNRTSDSIQRTCYKKPLLSSTPSMACKPSFRQYEPSISEISFSSDEPNDTVKSSMESGGSMIYPKSQELRVLVANNLELQRRITEQMSVSERSGEQSGCKRYGIAADNSKERFSHMDCDTMAVNKGVSKASHLLSTKEVCVELSRDCNFVSAKTHLDSLVAALKEKCRTSKPVVCLQRTSISYDSLNQGHKNQDVEYFSFTDCEVTSNCSQSEGNFHTKDTGLVCPGGTNNASQSQKKDDFCKNLGRWSASVDTEKDIITTDPLLQCEHDSPEKEVVQATVNGGTWQLEHQSRDLFSVNSQMENYDISDQNDASLKDFSAALCRSSQEAETGINPKCISMQPTISLKHLDLSKCTEGGRTTAPERGRAKQVEHQRSGGNNCAIRRRLSVLFSSRPTETASFSSEVSSPARKRTTGRLRVPDPPKDRPVTGRKACISGLSVSRWTRKEGWQKKKGGHTGSFITKTGDSSMVDFQLGFDNRKCHVLLKSSLLSTADVLPATPTHKEPMNVLSFLANFSPDCMTTHTWGKLKAALSVHKKKKVFITPHKLHLSQSRLFDEGVMDASREHPAFTQCTPLSQHLIARLPMSAEGVSLGLCSYAEDLTDAEKVYHECQQEGPITFEQCIPPDKMKLCKKIGEGTFGEVFSIVNDSMETVALKIIPIEGDQKVNGEEQKTFGEILQEIISSKELSSLGVRDNNRSQGFIGLNNLHCVQGPYPDLLLAAWDKFDEQRVSENDRPDFFPDNQLFLILEFEFGGSDLENFNCKLSSLVQAKSILHQVTVALAVAEQALCFEHRDLHWGNILVKNTVEKKGTYILNGIPHTFETKGVLVNIIDYSLSRLEIDGLTVFCDISANDELFMGQGDYQFDIYRKMREENNNSWSEYNPHTNVLWLRYLADKLLHVTYKNKSLSKPVKVLKKNLRKFYDEVLQFKSASSVLEGSSLFK